MPDHLQRFFCILKRSFHKFVSCTSAIINIKSHVCFLLRFILYSYYSVQWTLCQALFLFFYKKQRDDIRAVKPLSFFRFRKRRYNVPLYNRAFVLQYDKSVFVLFYPSGIAALRNLSDCPSYFFVCHF